MKSDSKYVYRYARFRLNRGQKSMFGLGYGSGVCFGVCFGVISEYVSRYVSGYVSLCWALDETDIVGVCAGVCIEVCVGGVKNPPFHEFLTPN